MKHKTSDLEGALLDAAVAKAFPDHDPRTWAGHSFRPSTDWQHGGPIIERERIAVVASGPEWSAFVGGGPAIRVMRTAPHAGPTPLIAAMRAFVASKLGDEVEL